MCVCVYVCKYIINKNIYFDLSLLRVTRTVISQWNNIVLKSGNRIPRGGVVQNRSARVVLLPHRRPRKFAQPRNNGRRRSRTAVTVALFAGKMQRQPGYRGFRSTSCWMLEATRSPHSAVALFPLFPLSRFERDGHANDNKGTRKGTTRFL